MTDIPDISKKNSRKYQPVKLNSEIEKYFSNIYEMELSFGRKPEEHVKMFFSSLVHFTIANSPSLEQTLMDLISNVLTRKISSSIFVREVSELLKIQFNVAKVEALIESTLEPIQEEFNSLESFLSWSVQAGTVFEPKASFHSEINSHSLKFSLENKSLYNIRDKTQFPPTSPCHLLNRFIYPDSPDLSKDPGYFSRNTSRNANYSSNYSNNNSLSEIWSSYQLPYSQNFSNDAK